MQANPNDERFDSRYDLTIRPWTPYLFKLKDGSEDLRVTIKYFQPYPGDLGGFAGSLLVTGKRPRGLNLDFDNHLDAKKVWPYLVEDYIPGLIDAGYNFVPDNNFTMAEISADKTTGEFTSDKEEILTIKPSIIEIITGDLFGHPFLDQEVYKTISEIMK